MSKLEWPARPEPRLQSTDNSMSDPSADHGTAWKADLCLVGVAVIWGVNIPIMKIGLEQIDVFVFNAVRLTISSVVLSLFARQQRKHDLAAEPGIRKRELFCYAVVISAVYQILFLIGVALTTSGNTALIIATVPLWTALLARVFIGEKLLLIAWTGLLVALAGTVIVALQKGDVSAGRQHLIGNLVILGAALCWAAGTVYSRPLLRTISPLQLSAQAALIALPIHWLITMGRLEESLPALRSGTLWAIIVYSGVLSTGLALPMWNYGVRHAGAAHSAIIQNLVPVVAILAAWITRGEEITPAQCIGGGLILGGLLIMRRTRLSSPKQRQEQE